MELLSQHIASAQTIDRFMDAASLWISSQNHDRCRLAMPLHTKITGWRGGGGGGGGEGAVRPDGFAISVVSAA